MMHPTRSRLTRAALESEGSATTRWRGQIAISSRTRSSGKSTRRGRTAPVHHGRRTSCGNLAGRPLGRPRWPGHPSRAGAALAAAAAGFWEEFAHRGDEWTSSSASWRSFAPSAPWSRSRRVAARRAERAPSMARSLLRTVPAPLPEYTSSSAGLRRRRRFSARGALAQSFGALSHALARAVRAARGFGPRRARSTRSPRARPAIAMMRASRPQARGPLVSCRPPRSAAHAGAENYRGTCSPKPGDSTTAEDPTGSRGLQRARAVADRRVGRRSGQLRATSMSPSMGLSINAWAHRSPTSRARVARGTSIGWQRLRDARLLAT